GSDYHRYVGLRAYLTQECKAILVPRTEIQDHEVNLVRGKATDHVLAARRVKDAHIVFFEIPSNHFAHERVVVHNEYPHRPAGAGVLARLVRGYSLKSPFLT